jgi:crossover junction endodeoxyribonuclease RusA
MVEASKKTKPWREAVRHEAHNAVLALPVGEPFAHNKPCSVRIAFAFPRPKSHSGKNGLRASATSLHAQKPDIDKLCRAVLDAMTGVVFNDDAQVVALSAVRQWCEPGEQPGAIISVDVFSAPSSSGSASCAPKSKKSEKLKR